MAFSLSILMEILIPHSISHMPFIFYFFSTSVDKFTNQIYKHCGNHKSIIYFTKKHPGVSGEYSFGLLVLLCTTIMISYVN